MEGGPQPSKLGRRLGGGQAQNPTKPTQLCATPPLAKSRRSPEAPRQSWTQGGPQGCGHTHGAGAPLVAYPEPNLARSVHTASPRTVQVGMVAN